ncbi:electron transfer flavoprotein subunit alpha/FixB family protein [Lentimicrobium sp.]|uniref:electron transfer flavoprotein subunit alpha/FixB family protein n=1 Tax=Lentimicrobium sp. TaxID=2034841 RepID=UPI0025CBCC43|nr:electron transfer flavoprotein subunit alpha/FixB family protein [Lentimicrobium sp.]MCO5255405.1 electron transfer flavoprotein subunit alpha/FixB family protein [Lentimicrobium sp.]MCO5261712.1 electron transfer flavoprotein subunit alpha/FixB family protein [Lentimicrobium sp.]HPF63254.1 electron transfer flavoprotein subunit alpha/FixB family protein [Lentimicrobium sp.]HPJ61028.1 electron transfer flavoprotein subunit alpha/FixB family protein [Lentimicrobium sp.]HPR24874.1 electron tr
MNNIFVYCELTEEKTIADVSLELLSKGRRLATELGVKLEAIVIGSDLKRIEDQVFPFGVDVVHVADDNRLFPYTTLPHASLVLHIFHHEKPEIAIFGATSIGRDLAPRIASALRCGLTADCTSLEIGDHFENKTQTEYKNLLYQIRPAFGGNIIATIINPETRPQMATVREGVMKKEVLDPKYKGQVKKVNASAVLRDEDFMVQIIERHMEASKINIKNAQVIIAGGYGVGSRENFQLLYDLADVLGAQVGASRAAVDAGFSEHERQIGQTGVTVRPKLYIACGISGAVQHRAGMDQSAQIISINTDPNAPINHIADYTIIGSITDVIPKMIRYYKANSK